MESEKKVAIRLSGIRKRYRLGSIGGRTLQAEIQSWWAKKRGKEDPNVRIGMDSRLIGQTFWALNGIDLTIYQGERVGIIGANGAGKSTMLKLLSRVTAPTEGEIDIYGRISSMLEVGTGFHGEMTGRENIYMNGAILGMKKSEIDQRMEEIIDFSEVRDFIDTPVKRYSSGMFVKLAFSVAAHLNSEIMIMDEVLAVGDMAFQTKCLDKMKKVADEEGRTILYVSHNMNTIRRLCDRVVVLDQGKIIFDGDVEEGIAIYMNHNLSENEVEIDLTDKEHSYGAIDFGVEMTHLSLVDKVTPVYNVTEGEKEIRMKLSVKAKQSFENVVVRATFRNEADVAIGTADTAPMNLQEGEQELDLCMPIEPLMKGTFYLTIGLGQVDEIGRNRLLDRVIRTARIEIIGKPTWGTTMHGYVKLGHLGQR